MDTAVAAAQQCGARAVGVELDAGLLAAAGARAEAAGVTERVELLCGDLFESDVRAATVVALYLLDSLNVRLRPKLLAECRPATRVVSYSFEMGDWEADAHTPIAANGVSLSVIPANFSGRWRVETSAGGFEELHLTQRYQRLGGTIRSGGQTRAIRSGTVKGGELSLTIEDAPGTIFGQLTNGMLSGVLLHRRRRNRVERTSRRWDDDPPGRGVTRQAAPPYRTQRPVGLASTGSSWVRYCVLPVAPMSATPVASFHFLLMLSPV